MALPGLAGPHRREGRARSRMSTFSFSTMGAPSRTRIALNRFCQLGCKDSWKDGQASFFTLSKKRACVISGVNKRAPSYTPCANQSSGLLLLNSSYCLSNSNYQYAIFNQIPREKKTDLKFPSLKIALSLRLAPSCQGALSRAHLMSEGRSLGWSQMGIVLVPASAWL